LQTQFTLVELGTSIGGSGLNGLSTQGEMSNRYWVAQYLDLSFYKLNGNPEPDYMNPSMIPVWKNSGSAPTDKGPLQCPGSNHTGYNPSDAWKYVGMTYDYRFPGLGTHGGSTLGYLWTTLSRNARPVDGTRKVLLMDIATPVAFTDHRAHLWTHSSGHSPGAYPRGMNLIHGDGSGAWVAEVVPASHNYTVSGVNYFGLAIGVATSRGADHNAVHHVGFDGFLKNIKKGMDEAGYYRYMSEFYGR
jgi:hypothetical protein